MKRFTSMNHESTSTQVDDRRHFMVRSLQASGGLMLGFALSDPLRAMDAGARPVDAVKGTQPPVAFAPNAFLRIEEDGVITLLAKHDEMGQGIHTGLAIAVCEELEVDVADIRVESAPGDPSFAHTQFRMQITGGSSSTYSSLEQMQNAGAVAREMLIAAAAQRWGVQPNACEARNGKVHRKQGDVSLSYGALAADAAKVQVPGKIALKERAQYTRIGKATARVDSPSKVRGTAMFGLDKTAPGMLTAMVVRSPYFGNKVRSFDAKATERVPGVRAVVEVPSGVAVIADGYWAAFKGRDVLKIAWTRDGLGATLDTDQLRKEFTAKSDVEGLPADSVGDADQALRAAKADDVLEAIYEVPYQAHAPMEPLNCMVTLKPDGGAKIVTGSQMIGGDMPAVAMRLKVDPGKIEFENSMLGGGFGRRANPASDFVLEAVEVALAGRALNAPIKTVWTREDDIRGGWYRPMWINRMHAVFKDGKVTAWRHRLIGQSIAAGTVMEPMMVQNGVDVTSVEGAAELPYAVAEQKVELQSPELPVPVQWWRSVGHSNTAFAKESFIDECAERLGKDAYEYRRELLAEHPRLQRVLHAAAKHSEWSSTLPKGMGRGIAVHESFKGFAAHVVEASVENGQPRIHRIVCAIDCGLVVNPDQVKAQLEGGAIFALSATLHGEITFKDGKVQQGNFDDFPIMRMHEAPMIEVHIVDSDDPMGGIGEVGVPGVASAVCSALAQASGRRIRKLPVKDQLA